MSQLFIGGEWRGAARRRHARDPLPGRRHARGHRRRGRRPTTRATPSPPRGRRSTPGRGRDTPERERAALLAGVADIIERDAQGVRPRRVARHRQATRRVRVRHRRRRRRASGTSPASAAPTPAGWSIPAGTDAISRIVHEPVGVCALITPWNYPLLQASWKVAPALLAGNTFVLKPSELTPSTAILLMRRFDEAGLPAGVANLVLGAGPAPGAPLSERPATSTSSRSPAASSPGTRIAAAAAAHGEAGRARTRRQEPERRLRRRRLRDRGRLRADRGVPALRAGLLGRRAADRRGVAARPVRRRAGRAGRATSRSAARSTTPPRPAR